jgi:hypothetical protein
MHHLHWCISCSLRAFAHFIRIEEILMNIRPLALAGLLVLAALSRLLPHPPNFAPITAMAVFGAVRFGGLGSAILVPLLAMLLSDVGKEIIYRNGFSPERGFYPLMWVIYGTFALTALLSRLARGTRSPAVIAATTLAGSCLFFVLTNFAIWAAGSYYPRTAEGLAECYVAAIPFFRNTLLGDATYATVLFGAWAWAEARFPALRPAPAMASP